MHPYANDISDTFDAKHRIKMEEITKREIKGLNAKNLIWLLSSIIVIEFTGIMYVNNITTNQQNNMTNINKLQTVQDKLIDQINDLKTRVKVMELETHSKSYDKSYDGN